ncbi:glycosyltransferase family 8 protein [Phocaeicola sartorii]|uniref:glycosyltransferase family 8 protein n=1 Tax=Phocaeicola sartorii TaxID=671267 RepID=UPI001F573839|nr:glycosyltransferase family 8 protein [Phocaeicola sartorii]
MDIKHIVCCTDDNYAPYCGTMIFSLLANSKGKYCIHILIESLNKENIEKLSFIALFHDTVIEFHEVDIAKLEHVKFRKKKPLSKAAYYRILLASTLDESIDKVLYLDCDMIILKDVSYFFDLDLDGYALAAIRDLKVEPRIDEHRYQLSLPYDKCYFNSGLLVINLEYWRRFKVENQLIEFAERKRNVYFHDQDALNYLFKGKWLMLPPQCCYINMCMYEQLYFENIRDFIKYKNDIKIIHYASNEKPWHKLFFYSHKNDFIKYYSQTPWKDKPLLIYKDILDAYKRIVFVAIRNRLYQSPLIVKIIFDLISFIISLCSLGKIKYLKWKV